MRVIAGIAKGKKLGMPKGSSVRPTLDKVKGAIFNILGSRIVDAVVLDLFSGSGALGIEALSRGACSCVFVDTQIKCIKDNLISVGLTQSLRAGAGLSTRVIKGNVERVIKQLAKENLRFDIVLADPPYGKKIARNILSWLEISGIVANSGLIVIEHSKRELIEREKVQEKRYGDTVVSVFKLKQDKRRF